MLVLWLLVSILTQEYAVCCSPRDLFMVTDAIEDVNAGKIVIVLKGLQPSSYSSSLVISFSLSSSCFNQSSSMHSVHLLPYLNLEKSIFTGLPPIISM